MICMLLKETMATLIEPADPRVSSMGCQKFSTPAKTFQIHTLVKPVQYEAWPHLEKIFFLLQSIFPNNILMRKVFLGNGQFL